MGWLSTAEGSLERRLPSRWPWAQAARLSASGVGLVLAGGAFALAGHHAGLGVFLGGVGWITLVWSIAGVLALRKRRAAASSGRRRH